MSEFLQYLMLLGRLPMGSAMALPLWIRLSPVATPLLQGAQHFLDVDGSLWYMTVRTTA